MNAAEPSFMSLEQKVRTMDVFSNCKIVSKLGESIVKFIACLFILNPKGLLVRRLFAISIAEISIDMISTLILFQIIRRCQVSKKRMKL